MPSQRKRIGFLPREEVQKIIDQICKHNKLSQSKVTGLLVEEALSEAETDGKFDKFNELNENVDFLISIGGDGSMLKAVTIVKDSNIPILGINTGRLGFLTSLGKESIELGLNQLLKSEFRISKRCLLKVYSNKLGENFFGFNYALNEVSVSRKNTASLISISAELNGVPLATYWADGLIIATPTGSTGYSLSSGGPVMTPESSSFVLTPIAAHNINIRPLIAVSYTHLTLPTNREV